jgi:hypothetical protein
MLGAREKPQLVGLLFSILAEAVRFELTNSVTRRQFSRLVPSTTRPRFLQTSIIHNSPSPGSRGPRRRHQSQAKGKQTSHQDQARIAIMGTASLLA